MSQSVQAEPLQRISSAEGDANAQQFLFQSLMAGTATSALVQVKAVTGGGPGQPCTVDVQPMVHQVDGAGNTVPHGIIHSLPCARIQGGAAAVIVDPVVGDIGAAIFASRDISAVKASRVPSQPGSLRRFDMADGMYFGTLLGGEVTDYVRVQAGAVAIKTTAVTIEATSVAITSDTLTHNGKDIGATHKHGGVTPGGGETGVPV
ncbi:hypothetical protein EOD42_16885 [Rhodovarius crocodyli]|uniref:Uncharacterized protein n=1 Tax=Rhodovarius crocodyli TaxID=1979269 RepID=A0A437MC88_9PROT|nr:Gp138 family membrane-puncturing spike protein [Rhodovarius crocodyli]RVT95259.1 hypothetical protein EOD42_16885 [Rhodovarius crocodyli]